MTDKITITRWLFGAGAVGLLTVAILAGDREPPTRPTLVQNADGWYHVYLCAELPATPPIQRCRHIVTRDHVKAVEWQASDSYVGSAWADLAGHPASQTPVVWGNPAPGRPRP